MVTNQIILIRHGHAQHMETELIGGWTDSSLAKLGRKQAYYTGHRLSDLLTPPFNFYSSDLPRAAETAKIIGKIVCTQPILVPDLRELNNGTAANLTLTEAQKLRSPITHPIIDWIPYPGAESWRMLHNRVVHFLERMPEGLTVLITHSQVIVSAIFWWLELPEEFFPRISFDTDLCSITHLRMNEWGEKTIAKLNDTGHLRA